MSFDARRVQNFSIWMERWSSRIFPSGSAVLQNPAVEAYMGRARPRLWHGRHGWDRFDEGYVISWAARTQAVRFDAWNFPARRATRERTKPVSDRRCARGGLLPYFQTSPRTMCRPAPDILLLAASQDLIPRTARA